MTLLVLTYFAQARLCNVHSEKGLGVLIHYVSHQNRFIIWYKSTHILPVC